MLSINISNQNILKDKNISMNMCLIEEEDLEIEETAEDLGDLEGLEEDTNSRILITEIEQLEMILKLRKISSEEEAEGLRESLEDTMMMTIFNNQGVDILEVT